MTGIIKNDPFVQKVKNGDKKALFAEVAFSHDGEVRTLQIFPGMGEDSWPCKGDIAVIEKASGVWYVAGIWDGEEPKRKPGERRLYGRKEDGSVVADILLDGDGNISLNADKDIFLGSDGDINLDGAGDINLSSDKDIKLNGDDKRLVTYAELDQELQRIWAAVKTHTHEVPGAMPGPAALAATPSMSLATETLDISAAETKTVKTGG